MPDTVALWTAMTAEEQEGVRLMLRAYDLTLERYHALPELAAYQQAEVALALSRNDLIAAQARVDAAQAILKDAQTLLAEAERAQRSAGHTLSNAPVRMILFGLQQALLVAAATSNVDDAVIVLRRLVAADPGV